MISKLAVVHPDAKLGEGVTVGPFAYIEADVEIDDNTTIHNHAVVLSGARIGKGCHIHPNAIIAGVPQDLKFQGEVTTAVIGNNTTIREFATVNRGTASKGTTIVGNNCLVMAYVHIGHDCVVGNGVILVNRVSLAGEVIVEDCAIIAGHCGVHQFTEIGAHSMCAALSKIGRNVPPFIKIGHDPISYVGVNSIGLRRRGFTTAAITEIQNIYRVIFQSGLSLSNAITKVEEDFTPSEYRDTILNFIKRSKDKRGIVKSFQTKLANEQVDF